MLIFCLRCFDALREIGQYEIVVYHIIIYRCMERVYNFKVHTFMEYSEYSLIICNACVLLVCVYKVENCLCLSKF